MVWNLRALGWVAGFILIWTVSYYIMSSSTTTTFQWTVKSTSSSRGSVEDDWVAVPIPVSPETTVTFCAHGDVPYTRIQARKLKKQMMELSSATVSASDAAVVIEEQEQEDAMDDIEFMIHLGDIRMAGPNRPCVASDYESVGELLRLSPVPVFMILGDNDVHDCPDPEEGLQLWRAVFRNFESTHWNHSFSVHRPREYPENFTFQHKNVLFVGVNIVGERTNDENIEMVTQRLTAQVNWVMEVMRQYQMECIRKRMVGRIVLFYHANPGPHTRPFFKPLRHFIGNDLNHTIPVLFMNGDAHRWMYQPRFYNETSLLRITVTGLAVEPLLKVTIPMDGIYQDPTRAFLIDRRLSSTATTTPPTTHGPPY